MIQLKGTKKVEVPYFAEQLIDNSKSVLIIGECQGGHEGISETIFEKGFNEVCIRVSRSKWILPMVCCK